MAQEIQVVSDRRKKRVKRIKNFIVTMCVILLLLPTFLSIFLFCRMLRLENKVDALMSQEQMETQSGQGTADVARAEEKHNGENGEKAVTGGALKEEDPVKKVYLTFDDGPSRETEKVLDILKKKNVKATFFTIGREDDFSKRMYRRIVKEGHTLGMHSYSHIYKEIYGSLEGFQKDFKKISEHLFDITGVKSVYYRFPGGSSNSVNQFPIAEYRSFLEQQGVTYLDWNVIAANGTTDSVTKEEMVNSVLDGVARYDTSIVLLYDSADKKMTAKSLGGIIDRLREEGYELLPIDQNTTPVQHS